MRFVAISRRMGRSRSGGRRATDYRPTPGTRGTGKQYQRQDTDSRFSFTPCQLYNSWEFIRLYLFYNTIQKKRDEEKISFLLYRTTNKKFIISKILAFLMTLYISSFKEICISKIIKFHLQTSQSCLWSNLCYALEKLVNIALARKFLFSCKYLLKSLFSCFSLSDTSHNSSLPILVAKLQRSIKKLIYLHVSSNAPYVLNLETFISNWPSKYGLINLLSHHHLQPSYPWG